MGLIVNNAYIGWPNRIDEATLSGGGWNASLPLANLQTRQVTEPARSTSAALTNTKFDSDFGRLRPFRGFALVNHNLSIDAKWRITLGGTFGGSEVLDSGWLDVWRLTFDDDLFEWGDAGWWEGASDDEYVRAPFAAIHVADGSYSARYMRIEIDDAGNTDGYVQIGRVFAGGGIVPTYNMSYGYSEQWESMSTVTEAESGSEFFSGGRGYRVARPSFEVLSASEVRTLTEMQRRLGVTGEVLWGPNPADAEHMQRFGFLARMRTLSPIEYPYYNIHRQAFEMKEII